MIPYRIVIRQSDINAAFRAPLSEQHRRRLLGVAGAKLLALSQQSFGLSAGNISRQFPWAKLSKNYAKRVRRGFATLDTSIGRSPYSARPTGRLFRSGRLAVSGDSAVVSYDSEYASFHQDGTSKMPPRPFMPIGKSGRLTPYAEREIIRSMQRELDLILQRKLPSTVY